MAVSTSNATLVFSIRSTKAVSGTVGAVFAPEQFSCATETPAVIASSSSTATWPEGFAAKPLGTPNLDPAFSGITITSQATDKSDKDKHVTNTVPFPCQYTLVVAYPALSESSSSVTSSTSSTTTSTTKTSKQSTTPSPTASPTPAQDVSHDGEFRASTVGLGVGLFLAVLLIAAFFFLRRYREWKATRLLRKANTVNFDNDGGIEGGSIPPSLPGPGPIYESMKAVPPSPGPGTRTTAGRGTCGLDFYLLDGAGDSDIRNELNPLTYLIKDYVDTYHGPQAIGQHHVSCNTLVESLSKLGIPEPTKLQIATLALVDRTRSSAIRSLLALVIFSALDFQSINPSLLPPAIANFRMAVLYDNRGSAASQWSKAMNTWRRTSAYLLHPNKQDRSPLPLPIGQFESQIKSLQSSLQEFLQYFTDTGSTQNNTAHKRELEKVIRACAKLGYALFSHPCEWRYIYETEGSSGSEKLSKLVVVPGLERVSGPDGEPYKSRQVVCEPVIEKVEAFPSSVYNIIS